MAPCFEASTARTLKRLNATSYLLTTFSTSSLLERRDLDAMVLIARSFYANLLGRKTTMCDVSLALHSGPQCQCQLAEAPELTRFKAVSMRS